MSIQFHCPCGVQLRVLDTQVNQLVRCPRCGDLTPVPAESSYDPPEQTESGEPLEGESREEKHGYSASRIRLERREATSAETVDRATDQEPVRRARPRPKRSRWLLVTAALLTCFLFLLAAGSGAGWYFFLRPKGLSDELNYMPDDFEWIASVKVATILESDFYKSVKNDIRDNSPDLEQGLTKTEKELGLDMTDIERLTAGGQFPRKKTAPGIGADSGNDLAYMVVIKTKKNVELDDLFKGQEYRKYTDEKDGDRTIRNFTNQKMSVCLPDRRTIISGPTDVVKRVVHRNAKAYTSSTMQDAMKKVDFTDAAALAFTFGDLVKDTLRDDAHNLDFPPGLGNSLDAEKFTRFIDSGVVQFRLGANVEAELQLFGKESKLAFSFSMKTSTLINLIETERKSKSSALDARKPPNNK